MAEGTTHKADVEASVCADILNRQKLGVAKYGKTVSQNPLELKQWLQHAYEESLDTCVYLKRILFDFETLNLETQTPEQMAKKVADIVQALQKELMPKDQPK